MAKRKINQNRNDQIKGLNVYTDEKNRVIYYHPLTKKAIYVPAFEQKTFSMYQKRYLLAACAFILLTTILADWFELPTFVPLLITIVGVVLVEFNFHKYLNKLQPVKHFNKEKCTGYFDILEGEDKTKMILRIILYLALGIVLVINAYVSKYDQISIVACWIILIGLVAYVGTLIYSLIRKKNK